MNEQNFTERDLLDAGYRKHERTHNHADFLFQKKIERNGATFWSNIYLYLHLADITGNRFSAEIQFYLPNQSFCDITLSNFQSIQEAEAFGEKFYKAFDCVADD